jgi:hypothetical protein
MVTSRYVFVVLRLVSYYNLTHEHRLRCWITAQFKPMPSSKLIQQSPIVLLRVYRANIESNRWSCKGWGRVERISGSRQDL